MNSNLFYRKHLLQLHLLTITIVSLVEFIAFMVFLLLRTYSQDFLQHFLYFNLLLPFVANFSAHLVARFLTSRPNLGNAFKDGAIVFATLVTASCLSILHRQYLITLCCYIFPIVLCGFFDNTRLLKILTVCSLASLTVAVVCILRESPITATLIIDLAAAYVFILISYFSSSLTLAASNTNQILSYHLTLDPMTKLFNRRTFDIDLAAAVRTFEQQAVPFCLAVVDIDNFKQINDTYGHAQGDVALLALRDDLESLHSQQITAYRYGGEEFALIFFRKTAEESLPLMEQTLQAFRSRTFPFTDQPITFSCGLAQYPGGLSSQDFFAQVDQRLYAAKNTGKNKIVASDSTPV